MEEKEEVIDGRKYRVIYSPDMPPGAFVIVGPPDGLMEMMGLPEPFATRLHNILYERRIFSYKDISSGKIASGVLQEALQIDAQILAEAFYNYEKESI